MKKFLIPLLIFTVLSSFAAPAFAGELVVSAAASLTDAFKDIKTGFEKVNQGVTVTLNFGASGALFQQIKNGAPVDVFASADEETMDKAEKEGLIAKGTRKDFAANSLVLIVPAGQKVKITSIKDLTSLNFKRIAIGKPESVPAGRYTKKALSADGLWDALSSKFVYAENVRQVLDYVKRGEVDAGFVYVTDAAAAGDKVKVAAEAKETGPITYPIAAVKDSANMEAADKFVEYVAGEKGREILLRQGFKIK